MLSLNWIGYFHDYDGYGRFNSRMVKTLRKMGVKVTAMARDEVNMASWMQEERGISFDRLSISSLPTFNTISVPGRHWFFTMVESNALEHEHLMHMHRNKTIERILVPCQENKRVFEEAGLEVPIHLWRGGTDPDEFPVLTKPRDPNKPYTFLAITDRGMRKGWNETWEAFYKAFGGKTTGIKDVRLILKYLPHSSSLDVMNLIGGAEGRDERIIYQNVNADSMYDIYSQADCVVLPSFFEGWGMPHREAAMMGLPVITQAYSGMDDGYTDKWALVVPGRKHPLDWWQLADIDAIAQTMKWCYDNRDKAKVIGHSAASWLRQNQTWEHAARNLLALIEEVGDGEKVSLEMERA